MVTRRTFLGAAVAAPLAASLGSWRGAAVSGGLRCVLPESAAGFEGVRSRDRTDGVVVFAGVTGWDDSIPRRVHDGALVLFESAAGFGHPEAFESQRRGLARSFGLILDPPRSLWSSGQGPGYVDFDWPHRARVRDYSSCVAVEGGRTVARLGAMPVASLRRLGAGRLLFLGSPIGPALWSGDPEARAWLVALRQPMTASSCRYSTNDITAPSQPMTFGFDDSMT